MTAPKRDARALLATGGLLLVPVAALWLILSPRLSGTGGPPAPPAGSFRTRSGAMVLASGGSLTGIPGAGTPEEAALPVPCVAAGAPTQAEWTLLVMTRLTHPGFAALPDVLAPPRRVAQPLAVARNLFVEGAAGGMGLWIGVRGGLGVRTLTIPEDGRRHVYPFGNVFFVAKPTPHSVGLSFGWEGRGGRPLSGTGKQPPYDLNFYGATAAPGQPDAQTVTLIPSALSDKFRVTAQPLSVNGRPTGRAVGLLCQPVTTTALFAQIPAGYSAQTRQFRVTVARAGAKGGGASWQLADLPPSVQNGPDSLPFAVAARVGPFTLHAVAAEAEDSSGNTDFVNRRPDSRREGPSPQNIDGHQWTGVPTVRYLLTARAASPPVPGQSWLLQLDRVTPQWATLPLLPAPPGAASEEKPLGLLPLTRSYVPLGSPEWVLQDGEVGAAYPGQQRRVIIEGTALRSAQRTETLTFHDAEVVSDGGFGGDRIVWRRPETETTRSGISVTVLNGRAGRRDTTAPQPSGHGFGGDWWYDRGNAELLLAWRLPPGVVSGQRAALNAPRIAQPPQGATPPPGSPAEPGTLLASWDNMRPDPYAGAVAPPGARDARPLIRAGYSPLRLSVWAPQTPKRTPTPMFLPGRRPAPRMPRPWRRPALKALPPYSWREGSDVLTATPLPRHLKTLTLQITLREEQERRPIRLVVPVWPSLPPGADPNAPKPVPIPKAAPTPSPSPASGRGEPD